MRLCFVFLFVLPFNHAQQQSQQNHTLHHKLHDWSLLHLDDITVVKKRPKRNLDDHSTSTLDKEVIFRSYGRDFHLSLFPNPDIFHGDFKVKVHDKDGKIHHQHFNKDEVMTGRIVDEPGSKVHLHMNGKDEITLGSIHLKDDVYFIEPAWRHIEGYSDKHMLVYRFSDLKDTHLNHIKKNSPFCTADKETMKGKEKQKFDREAPRREVQINKRKKREVVEEQRKICSITLVADYKFFYHMARENQMEAISYLVFHISKVDDLFKATNWDATGENDISGYTLQIKDIIIHKASGGPTYNHGYTKTASQLLSNFSFEPHNTCLAHLFTYYDFDQGLLGLAYVAEVSKGNEIGSGGGICARKNNAGSLQYNTGLTSMKNWGRTILSVEAYLVTAHEIGHNYGATHDESNSTYNCAPGQDQGGNYLMFPVAVKGNYQNNMKFSSCSKQGVLKVIETRADWCFQKASEMSKCGNFEIEEGEECDVGNKGDNCCTKDCKLTPGSYCAPTNFLCCDETCQISPATKLCRSMIPGLCEENTYCNGVNLTCPESPHLEDNSDCGDQGKCKNGTCQSFCTTKGLVSCFCQNEEDQCKRCCADNATDTTSSCKVYDQHGSGEHLLKDNSTCAVGFCLKGKCVKQTQDVIERVLDLFSEIAPDKIGRFLADNIVGGVIVFSLLFWIPFSCFIDFVDKKRQKHQEEEEARYNFNNSTQNFDFYQRSIGMALPSSRYQPIAEHDSIPPTSDGGSPVTDDDDESGAPANSSSSGCSKGYFPPAKLNHHTQIAWSDDDNAGTVTEQPPIAFDDENNVTTVNSSSPRARLFETSIQPQQKRPPFMRAQALIITSPSSPPTDIMHLEPLEEEQEVTPHRPSLQRQSATEERL